MHVNFLVHYLGEILKPGFQRNVICICDGGPDWSVKGMINFVAFGMMWQQLRLDCLILCCYAPGHSRFNPIERSWAALTKWMTGVTLPHSIEENDFEEPKENEPEKWEVVLNNAVE